MKKNIHDLPPALDRRDEITNLLKGKKVAFFLDYDGTLTPIVERPELAVMSDEMRSIIKNLSRRNMVAIVSGRDRPDVEKLVELDNLAYAGSHGFDIAGPGGKSIENETGAGFSGLLARVREQLDRELGAMQGCLLEPKKFSIAVHYRLVEASQVKRIKDVVHSVLSEHNELRMIQGKKVYEIQPRVEWDKGKSVLLLMKALELDGPGTFPIYIGDDITDEDAFRVLESRGIGILVGHAGGERGDHPTTAHYFLNGPDEVGKFLEGFL